MESQEQSADVVSEQPEAEVKKPRTRAPRKRTTKATAVAETATETTTEATAASETAILAVEAPVVAAPEPAEPAEAPANVVAEQPAPIAPNGASTEASAPVEAAQEVAAPTTTEPQPQLQPQPQPQPQQRQERPRDRRDGGQRDGGQHRGDSNGASDHQRHQEQGRGFRNRQQQRDRDRDRDRDRNSDLILRDTPLLSVSDLDAKQFDELHTIARDLNIANFQRYKKIDLIGRILQAQSEAAGYKYGEGVLDIIEDGFGFLRGERYLPGPDDIYVSQSQIRRFGLRTGDKISGQIRPPKESEKFHSLLRVEAVNGVDPEVARRRPNFDTLTPIFPLELIDLETQPHIISTRLLNLVAPIGRGQRGLIVSPPKAGKTIILKAIANGVTSNYQDIHLMVCLIGERPEEVTDMKRSVDGEVVSSTFDEPVEDHTKVAEMVLERSKRLVEGGRDVVILLDSITRLARAYNLAVPPSGRTLSGGIDPIALYPPKRFFGAARNIEGGGSLTIVATCLVDTGSRMDDVIYEEFKGTGNMELHLDRKLAERRIYPSIDIQRSGTRREDLLLDEHALRQVYTMRRMVSMLGGTEGTELVLARLAKTPNNAEFLLTLTKDM
jgi:transcription termination factor Rho